MPTPRGRGSALARPAPAASRSGDEQLLHDLLTQLTRLEQDTTRLQEGRVEGGAVAALLLVTAVVNSMVARRHRALQRSRRAAVARAAAAGRGPSVHAAARRRSRSHLGRHRGRRAQELEEQHREPRAAVSRAVPRAARRARLLRQHREHVLPLEPRARRVARHLRAVRRRPDRGDQQASKSRKETEP